MIYNLYVQILLIYCGFIAVIKMQQLKFDTQ